MNGWKRTLLYLFFTGSLLFVSCSDKITLNHQEIIFEIKKGDSIHTISRKLTEQKIISDAGAFELQARLMGKASKLKYGVYLIRKDEKYSSVINSFSSGESYTVRLTIPEGFNSFQIADLIEQKGFGKKEVFLNALKDPALLGQIGLNKGDSIEGFLYPDTYMIPENYPEEKIAALMINQFKKIINQDVIDAIKSRNLSIMKVLNMAAIVEKEAKLEYEKPIIAGVYYNRLKKGMKLQADPTLIYALLLDGKYDGDIKFKDFNYDSKYNTYRYYGMPPGPIANPGRTSILAAIYPADVDYYYFVAKPDGSHAFSATLQEHNQAVYQYQKLPAIERRKQRNK